MNTAEQIRKFKATFQSIRSRSQPVDSSTSLKRPAQKEYTKPPKKKPKFFVTDQDENVPQVDKPKNLPDPKAIKDIQEIKARLTRITKPLATNTGLFSKVSRSKPAVPRPNPEFGGKYDAYDFLPTASKGTSTGTSTKVSTTHTATTNHKVVSDTDFQLKVKIPTHRPIEVKTPPQTTTTNHKVVFDVDFTYRPIEVNATKSQPRDTYFTPLKSQLRNQFLSKQKKAEAIPKIELFQITNEIAAIKKLTESCLEISGMLSSQIEESSADYMTAQNNIKQLVYVLKHSMNY